MNVAIIDLLVQLNQSINTCITCFSMTIMTTLVIYSYNMPAAGFSNF